MRMKFMRILPETWAIIVWLLPFSSFTRNIALGRDSSTVASTRKASSLGIGSLSRRVVTSLLDGDARTLLSLSSVRQDFRAGRGHRDGVLKVSCRCVVLGDDRPTVIQNHHIRLAEDDHGLNCQCHTGLQIKITAFLELVRNEVGDLGILVHAGA